MNTNGTHPAATARTQRHQQRQGMQAIGRVTRPGEGRERTARVLRVPARLRGAPPSPPWLGPPEAGGTSRRVKLSRFSCVRDPPT